MANSPQRSDPLAPAANDDSAYGESMQHHGCFVRATFQIRTGDLRVTNALLYQLS